MRVWMENQEHRRESEVVVQLQPSCCYGCCCCAFAQSARARSVPSTKKLVLLSIRLYYVVHRSNASFTLGSLKTDMESLLLPKFRVRP